MQLDLTMDNDVLIKCSCYSLLGEVSPSGQQGNTVGVLGAARFVVGKYLERRGRITDRESARQRFEEFLSSVVELEPTADELELSSAIEEAAVRAGVELDSGESQLCAIAVRRGPMLLLTGDKRAIAGAEVVQHEVTELSGLAGSIVCLEQVIAGISERLGVTVVRERICAEPQVDKTLSICFQCHSAQPRPDSFIDGLLSYVHHMRTQAASLLYVHDRF
ncbi:hypothetical protein [Streptomyces longwoodensis]|uniref:hypothetical protein n=1 Tax=Streptomyces longwoodensis TaxID=68231 RepID=UPI0030DF9723